ncbi:hypothetical protein ACIQNU_03460 [Streptomyces sp. NPDC091292]|uniref:hypothetical protein n=1 Tax=Streptomyces sp. NPDC091292 TaxID=3365991 RepID=UPI00380DF33B
MNGPRTQGTPAGRCTGEGTPATQPASADSDPSTVDGATDNTLRAQLRTVLARFIDPDDDTMPALSTDGRGFTWVATDTVLDDLTRTVAQLQRERDGLERMYYDAMRDLGNAIDRLDAVRARALRPAAIRAAAAALGEQTLNLLGRDLGTLHVEAIAEATVRAALAPPKETP